MQLEIILASLHDLCSMPIAWAIFAAVALRAAWSVVGFFQCPIVRKSAVSDPHGARARLQRKVLHSWRFLFAMLIGMALAIGGLYALRMPDVGPLALAAIVFGVFILIVEPSRLSVEENTLRVSAASLDGPAAYRVALDRLRAAHMERISMEVALAALFGVAISVF